MMKFCVVIPVYNHGESLAGTIDRLSVYDLPIILVDDGSDAASKAFIAELTARNDVDLITHAENQGKGAALMAGLRAAWEHGYTHVLQIDADGQHDLNDVGRFLDEARGHPDALVSGVPQFDDSIPRSRFYGRYITRFWVAVETLSLKIPDTMCGFRVYPLKASMRLIDERKLGSRMEFDIEIAVRLYWRGVDFVPVPTRVIYPESGVSHFRLGRDNWLISKTHAKLFFGMLLRLPLLLGRKMGVGQLHWSGLQERGGTLGLKILFNAYRTFGRGTFTVLLYPVMTYFYLTSPQARRASKDFLRRVEDRLEKEGRRPAKRLSSFKHFIRFGDSILDKTATWAGEVSTDTVHYVDPDIYKDIVGNERGGIFIGSHLGNLEALRAFGGIVQHMTVNALVFTRHSIKFMEFLERANPKAVEHFIQVDTLGPDSIIQLREKIDAGEWIAMVADRTSVSFEARAMYCDFLGSPAAFPEGPFILASLLECPVYLLFCLKVEDTYNVHLVSLANPLELPRKTRRADLQVVVERFAHELEALCLEAPYQWFNFFDFWQKSELRKGA